MKERICPDGGIGRRTRFRCERNKILGSSSLLLGTICFFAKVCVAREFPEVSVSSDDLMVDINRHMCFLNGHAKVTVTKNNDKYDFFAMKIEILYDKEKTKLPKKITACGFVKFIYGDVKISSDSCQYNMNKILFEDHVFIINKNLGTIKADKAVYDINTKKIDVVSKNKVRVNFKKSL